MFSTLPPKFPHGIGQPKFSIGDRARFVPLPAEDYGIIIGLQFVPAAHLPGWGWRYTLWLDPQSPSRAWTDSDLVWEDDLQRFTLDSADPLSQEQPA